MASERRLERLNTLLKEELGRIIDREVELSSNSLLTITRVEISHDVHYAKIYVSVLGANPEEDLEILTKDVYNIQQALNKKVRIRPVPRIRFVLDDEELRREKIERVVSKIKKDL